MTNPSLQVVFAVLNQYTKFHPLLRYTGYNKK